MTKNDKDLWHFAPKGIHAMGYTVDALFICYSRHDDPKKFNWEFLSVKCQDCANNICNPFLHRKIIGTKGNFIKISIS